MDENPVILKPGISIKPQVNEEDVERILKTVYGLNCVRVRELNGYDDRNFHIEVNEENDNSNIKKVSEEGYVLKIVNSLDSKKVPFFQAQNEMLLYLNKKNISCPRPVKTSSGEYYAIETFVSGSHIVRLLEFITGLILYQVVPNCKKELFYETGKYIANLDDCLTSFQHSVFENHKTLWMLTSVPCLKQFLYVIQETHKREMVEAIVEQFERRVLTVYQDLEKGVIHGDFNEQNILVEKINEDWRIKAVLDFGDCQFACYLFELAITMAYMMLQKSVEIGGYVLAGYVSVKPLPVHELRLLKICIEARLCQSLVIGAYSSQQDPNNSYILVNSKPGWALLEELWKQTDEKLLGTWKSICEKVQLDTFK